MAKSVILLCLTALLLCGGAVHARIPRQEITRGQPDFNTVARAAAASSVNLHGLVSDFQDGGAAGGGGRRGIGGGSSDHLHLSPHHFRRGGGGGGREGPESHSDRDGMAWHRRRFVGDHVPMEREMRNRGRNRTTGPRASGMHRMAQSSSSSMFKAAEPSARRLPQNHRTMEHLRAEISRYNQMARRGHGQGFRGQGRHGFPDFGRFDANGPHRGSAMDGRLSMMSHRFGVRGPHLNWMPQGGRHPALDLGGQDFPRRRGHRGGHHGMHRMGHGADGGFMGGPHRGGRHGMGPRFAAP